MPSSPGERSVAEARVRQGRRPAVAFAAKHSSGAGSADAPYLAEAIACGGGIAAWKHSSGQGGLARLPHAVGTAR
jgi:hypothetical protein